MQNYSAMRDNSNVVSRAIQLAHTGDYPTLESLVGRLGQEHFTSIWENLTSSVAEEVIKAAIRAGLGAKAAGRVPSLEHDGDAL